MSQQPLPPAALANRLAEVYLVVGPLYRRVSRVVERSQPEMGMSVGVRAVLEQLRREGDRTVPQMAQEQALSRQFVQRMVNAAQESGWVQLLDNPAHRKSSLVHLTAVGDRAIGAVLQREHDLMGQVRGDLTEGDVEATLRVLGAMLAGLEEVERGDD